MSFVRNEFSHAIDVFLNDFSEEHFINIKNTITKVQSAQEANKMFADLQIKRTAFAAKHFKQAEMGSGIIAGGIIGLGAGSAYEGIINGVAPTLTTGYFSGGGAVAGLAYKFFSSEMQNRQTKHYPIFLKLIELERLANSKESEFTISTDLKETGLRRRR